MHGDAPVWPDVTLVTFHAHNMREQWFSQWSEGFYHTHYKEMKNEQPGFIFFILLYKNNIVFQVTNLL